MGKLCRLKIFVLAVVLVVALVFIGFNLVEAQVKVTKGKTLGRPPKSICNNNGNCEWEEYNSNGRQSCSDCLPKTYNPLGINEGTLQIVTTSHSKVYQYKYVESEGRYHDTWASNEIGSVGRATSVGDADNDGLKEIITIVNYLVGEAGKGRNKKKIYDQKIIIFEDGCQDGNPDWESPYLGEYTSTVKDLIIADVDDDNENEIVILKGRHIEIFKITQIDGSYIFGREYDNISTEYENIIYTIDVGDADNDGKNEIVLAMFYTGAPIILNYENGVWEEITAEPIDVHNPILDFLGIDVAKVKDADNLKDEYGLLDNEIIAGGNNNRLMIWKYDKTSDVYKSEFISDDLGGFTQGVDAGDIDGDGKNEIAIASSYYNDTLYIYKYEDNSYQLKTWILRDGSDIGLEVGDIDNDGRAEIVSSTKGITVFDFIGDDFIDGYLEKTYNCVFGSYLKIN